MSVSLQEKIYKEMDEQVINEILMDNNLPKPESNGESCNCLIISDTGEIETCFHFKENEVSHINLYGYAIIPSSEYEELKWLAEHPL